jgi:alpha-tubulin suppressor-like RCC1 family protein
MKLFLALLPLAAAACTDQPTAPRPRVLATLSLSVAERTDIWLSPASYDSVPVLTSSAVAFRGMDDVQNVFGASQVFHFVAMAPGRTVVLFRYADGTHAVEDTINVHKATTALRVLKTLSLSVGQRADITPGGQFEYDSLPALSSSAVAFLSMSRVTLYTPEGPAGQVQVYHLVAMATGQTVVTLRYIDGTATVQDTISVQAAAPHGTFAQISTGFFLNTCAVTTRGAGYCWGGRGTSSTDSSGDAATPFYNTPVAVSGGLTFAAISGGGSGQFCGLTADGSVYCWPANSAPAAVAGGLTFKAVSAGIYHTCALATSGVIYCWGNNSAGQLGNGTIGSGTDTPTAVSGGLTFMAVGAGYQYSCGLTVGGSAYCWGDNDYGELGTGNTTFSPVPVPVSGGLSFVALSTGYFHACGLTQGGAAYCWGGNFAGELGNGSAAGPQQCAAGGASYGCSTTPVAVSGGLTFGSLSAGQWTTCGVTTGGVAYCWGSNGYGQLGNGTSVFNLNPSPAPVPVSGGLTFASVSTGYLHTCGVTTQGAAYCWGDNSEGELGDGSTTIHPTPVLVYGP